MKRNRKTLRFLKTGARFFKKNNIFEINFNNDMPPADVALWRYNMQPRRCRIIVTFQDGTKKEASHYHVWPMKLTFKEKTNDN